MLPRPRAIAAGTTFRSFEVCRSRTRRAAAGTPTRRRAVAAVQPIRRQVRISLDPHHRKNDHAGRLGCGADIAATTDRTMSFWKLDDDSHATLPGHRRRLL